MPDVIVLVDLANTPVYRGIHNPNPSVLGARLDTLLTAIIKSSDDFLGNRLVDLRFRLYDGWFDIHGRGTDIHGMMRRHVRSTYPTRRPSRRVFVDLAEAPLAASEDKITYTFRVQAGVSRYHLSIRTDAPEACARPAECGIGLLRSWFKGTCPVVACTVTPETVVSYKQQKLVDTSLVADLVWSGSQGAVVLVVSDDEDVLPGLITASAFGATIGWASRALPRAPYASLVEKHGIRCIVC